MIEGIVISLEILGLIQGMGNRGSKSDSHISVKEQRVDGSSIFRALGLSLRSANRNPA